MTLSLAFWVTFLVAILYGGWSGWQPAGRPYIGQWLVFCILVFLLGWAQFGPPIHG